MLTILVPAVEVWDETNEMFVRMPEVILNLEHSLVSLSRWESKYHTPFLTRKKLSTKEILDYVCCMAVDKTISPDDLTRLTEKDFTEINDYINDTQTATWFSESNNGNGSVIDRGEAVTSEIIYYWMVSLNIPFECQYWHLNRLLTLIRVCNVKNQPPKKMSQKALLSRNHALNAARRKALKTKG